MPERPNATVCPRVSGPDIASINKDLVLVDVRSPIAFETERVAGSVNMPLDALDSRFDEISRTGQLIVVCGSGKRADR
jgi:rhodanese-related sulfurtransferase